MPMKNSSNNNSNGDTPNLQSLHIQNPDSFNSNHQSNGNNDNIAQNPPLEPPPFETPHLRQCTKQKVRVQNANDNGPCEVLILTSIPTTVDEMLSSLDPAPPSIDDEGHDNNNNMDSFDDSDSSDFSSSLDEDYYSEEEEEEDGDIMEEDSSSDSTNNDNHRTKGDANNGKKMPPPQCTSIKTSHVPPENNNERYKMMGYWLRKEPLCENTHGRFTTHVYYAKVVQMVNFKWIATQEVVAIKAISWQCIKACRNHLSEDFIKEIAALKYISDWHINGQSNIRDTHVLTADMVMSNKSHLFIVMPYCDGGDLCMRVAEQRRFSEDESRLWFRQILKGLKTLQNIKICHRDLSPENMIILDDKVLVIDFGMALRIPYGPSGTVRHLIMPQTPCGKLPHMSPELLRKRPFDGHAIDIWAAGTILLFMLTGQRLQKPPQIDHAFDNLQLDGVSHDAMDLLRKMFRLHPNDRLSLDEVIDHPFVRYQFLAQR